MILKGVVVAQQKTFFQKNLHHFQRDFEERREKNHFELCALDCFCSVKPFPFYLLYHLEISYIFAEEDFDFLKNVQNLKMAVERCKKKKTVQENLPAKKKLSSFLVMKK